MGHFEQRWKDSADGGYSAALRYVFRVFTAVAVVGLMIAVLTGCQDRYRYPCQNPDNFHKPECQKPKCLFTQMCPEYLVAPVLEKQIAQPQQQSSEPAAPNR